jgi:hypothetical protein
MSYSLIAVAVEKVLVGASPLALTNRMTWSALSSIYSGVLTFTRSVLAR